MTTAREAIATGLDLVRIPGATFEMGDRTGSGFPQERPVHHASIDDFWIGRRCVTANQYLEFIRDADDEFDENWCDFINPCFIVKSAEGYRVRDGAGEYPMVQVSFVGAGAYCNARSIALGLKPVYDLATMEADFSRDGLRLPTEAEWEYACGGPLRYQYGYGQQFDADLVCHAHVGEAVAARQAGRQGVGGFSPFEPAPVPAGTLPPNDFGLREMLGNVNEWCHDRYDRYAAAPARNPRGAAFGSFRAVRGGSFIDGAQKLRTSYRHGLHFESKCMIDGFRVAMNA